MAHSRRQRENDTFTDIAEALPIQENAKDLDKASILRVAIHYLKLRDIVGEKKEGDQEESQETGNSEEGEEGEEEKSPEEQAEGQAQGEAGGRKRKDIVRYVCFIIYDTASLTHFALVAACFLEHNNCSHLKLVCII